MAEKECFKCGVVKPLGSFYKHPGMRDGRVNKCKDCNKLDVRRNRADNVEHYREYDRKRGNRQDAEYLRSYRSRYPGKYMAHSAVSNAVRGGKIKKPDECEVCGSEENIHAHHDDYAKPLDVRWLCAVCHKAWHLVNGEAKNATQETTNQSPIQKEVS